jgi:hypothetical protein
MMCFRRLWLQSWPSLARLLLPILLFTVSFQCCESSLRVLWLEQALKLTVPEFNEYLDYLKRQIFYRQPLEGLGEFQRLFTRKGKTPIESIPQFGSSASESSQAGTQTWQAPQPLHLRDLQQQGLVRHSGTSSILYKAEEEQ